MKRPTACEVAPKPVFFAVLALLAISAVGPPAASSTAFNWFRCTIEIPELTVESVSYTNENPHETGTVTIDETSPESNT